MKSVFSLRSTQAVSHLGTHLLELKGQREICFNKMQQISFNVKKRLSWCEFWHRLAVKIGLIKPNATASKRRVPQKSLRLSFVSWKHSHANTVHPQTRPLVCYTV